MKIRSCFVSNSSSSSFVVFEDLTSKGVACLKLSKAQFELMKSFLTRNDEHLSIEIDPTDDVYLTQFISDSHDAEWDLVMSVEHFEYENGQMCEEPYTDDEYYNEYTVDGKPVYLRKDHDEAKQMPFSKFAREFKKTYGDIDVIVKYDENGIQLTYVRD